MDLCLTLGKEVKFLEGCLQGNSKSYGLTLMFFGEMSTLTQETDNFIALIHPIQWTIAYPVGADRPAKHQKKTSCVSTGRPVPSTSALARWRVVLPSCLDRVTS